MTSKLHSSTLQLLASSVCNEKYWIVDKAFYGLDAAPRSWSIHRNNVITSITNLHGSNREVRCFPMEEDANIWVVVDSNQDKVVTYLALYVDDIMLVGEGICIKEVAKTLKSKWTTTPVVWAEDETCISFDGFEMEPCENGYIVHQRSYARELLKQYVNVEGVSNVPCPKDITSGEHADARVDLTKTGPMPDRNSGGYLAEQDRTWPMLSALWDNP